MKIIIGGTKRLKIVEQIAIVLLFAVLIPMSISGFIINNINQHAVREQLQETAKLIANMISDEAEVFTSTANSNLEQIAITLDTLPTQKAKQRYINYTINRTPVYKEIYLLKSQTQCNKLLKKYQKDGDITFRYKTSKGNIVFAVYNVEVLKKHFFKPLKDDKRQIYILNNENKLIASLNQQGDSLEQSIKQLPKRLKTNTIEIYGNSKNQPIVYLKKLNPSILIIVNTPKDMTKSTIGYNRTNIILAVLISALSVLLIVGLYTFYLYINIRQLFKAIIAISNGNYRRRIRPLINIFTPHEIIFLADEFNRMISQINKSYSKLKKSNKELKELNEFRSNMIDTVSHEFRTPLTSIQGYTSRLLRQDIEIDKETQQKSLKVIKRQSERLKRMIEDLLVIPDIEDSRLNMIIDTISIPEVVGDAILLVKNASTKNIVNNIPEDISPIFADRDRFEQVVINLVENAVKYADEDSDIILNAVEKDNRVYIEIKNKYRLISREKLKTLFGKFTRIDDKTTRTTRGTGLGLYIVKGLVEAMNGEIRLYSTEEYGFISRIYFEKADINN